MELKAHGWCHIKSTKWRNIRNGCISDFNVNEFQKEGGSAIFSNPIIESVYEMGSIIKPLTMVAGIDAGADSHYYIL